MNQMSGFMFLDRSGSISSSRMKTVEFSLSGGQLKPNISFKPSLITRAIALCLAVIRTIEALHLFSLCISDPVKRSPHALHLSLGFKFLLCSTSSVRSEFVLAWNANFTKQSDVGALQLPMKKLESFEFFRESNEWHRNSLDDRSELYCSSRSKFIVGRKLFAFMILPSLSTAVVSLKIVNGESLIQSRDSGSFCPSSSTLMEMLSLSAACKALVNVVFVFSAFVDPKDVLLNPINELSSLRKK
ncbi:hypothetical protein M9Y10_020351 [Tritrichomonas musculus]|uniref:Uncharacterized protein n=1 Tax=Tritrichomonas musculus TaxID=1915356 RepID=A0ABR2HFX0_9EUKA